ncbi:ATP-dependent DNA helicase RecG, partial [Pseudoxanthomonas sp. SGD-10]
MNNQVFHTPIEYLKGVGPQRAEVLKKEIGVFTYKDLLHYYPFRYIDRTRYYKVNEVAPDSSLIQIIVRLRTFEILGEKHTKRLVAKVYDDTGELELVWFKGLKWIEKKLKQNQLYLIFGKPTFFNGNPQMAHPEIEEFSKENKNRGNLSLQPVYSSTEKLKQFTLDSKGIQKLISNLLDIVAEDINDFFPSYILDKYNLLNRKVAL